MELLVELIIGSLPHWAPTLKLYLVYRKKKLTSIKDVFLGKMNHYICCPYQFFCSRNILATFSFTFTFASFLRLFHFACHSDCNNCINHINSSVLCITMQQLDNLQIDIKQFRTNAPLYIRYSVANAQPIFFLFGSPKAGFGPLTRGRLSHLMLITAFYRYSIRRSMGAS